MSIRILLVDDHRSFREEVQALLAGQPGMTVIAEAGDGREAVRLAAELKPDVVLMDIGMPGLNGLEATWQIKAQAPGVQVIALSMYRDERFVSEMLRAGASGYLLKESAFEELAGAIQVVAKHVTYLSPGIVGLAARELISRQRDGSRACVSTTRGEGRPENANSPLGEEYASSREE